MAQLSQEEKMAYTEMFLKVDAESGNGDGALTIDEFEKLLIFCGHRVSRTDIAKVYLQLDTDENWKITLDEFLAVLPRLSPPDSADFAPCADHNRHVAGISVADENHHIAQMSATDDNRHIAGRSATDDNRHFAGRSATDDNRHFAGRSATDDNRHFAGRSATEENHHIALMPGPECVWGSCVDE